MSDNLREDIVQQKLQELECTYFERAQILHKKIAGAKADQAYLLMVSLQVQLAMRDAVLEVAQKLGVEIEKTEG